MIDFNYDGVGSKVVIEALGDGQGKVLMLNCTVAQFEDGLKAYAGGHGALAKDAFPFLTAEEREFLLSGMLSSEFAALCTEGDYTEEYKMDKLRIPTRWLRDLAEDLKEHPDRLEWEFTTDLGNVLHVYRTERGGLDVLDLSYNDGED
jgi:hypothetical protein